MSAATDPTIWIGDVDTLEYDDVNGLTQAPVDFNGARVRVIRYAAGTKIAMHKHTKKTLKVILRGKMSFEGIDGPLGEVSERGMYVCGIGFYRADVLEDTVMLLVEEPGSERVGFDA
jgi:hypothetical protein